MIIGLDFDGTVCEHAYPSIGQPNTALINLLIEAKGLGHQIILWTCRSGIYLEQAVEWLRGQGIEVDAVNDDVPSVKNSEFGQEKSCKIYADLYIDDRNGTIEDLAQLIVVGKTMGTCGG